MNNQDKLECIEKLKSEISTLEEKMQRALSDETKIQEATCIYRNQVLYDDCNILDWDDFLCGINTIRSLATASLSPDIYHTATTFLTIYDDLYPDGLPARIVVRCSSVIPCGEGVRLIISDPYRSITTHKLRIHPDTATGWIGKLLLLDTKFLHEEYIITRVRLLKDLKK